MEWFLSPSLQTSARLSVNAPASPSLTTQDTSSHLPWLTFTEGTQHPLADASLFTYKLVVCPSPPGEPWPAGIWLARGCVPSPEKSAWTISLEHTERLPAVCLSPHCI